MLTKFNPTDYEMIKIDSYWTDEIYPLIRKNKVFFDLCTLAVAHDGEPGWNVCRDIWDRGPWNDAWTKYWDNELQRRFDKAALNGDEEAAKYAEYWDAEVKRLFHWRMKEGLFPALKTRRFWLEHFRESHDYNKAHDMVEQGAQLVKTPSAFDGGCQCRCQGAGQDDAGAVSGHGCGALLASAQELFFHLQSCFSCLPSMHF